MHNLSNSKQLKGVTLDDKKITSHFVKNIEIVKQFKKCPNIQFQANCLKVFVIKHMTINTISCKKKITNGSVKLSSFLKPQLSTTIIYMNSLYTF